MREYRDKRRNLFKWFLTEVIIAQTVEISRSRIGIEFNVTLKCCVQIINVRY